MFMVTAIPLRRENPSGQARADDVLATIAGVLRRASRRGDVVARFGADDFVLLLNGVGTEQALGVAGRVRSQVTDSFALAAEAAPVAIGVATAPEHGDSLDALVAAARRAVQGQLGRATSALAIAESAADPPRPAIERFVGRVAETRRLEQTLDAAIRGDSRIVTIAGPAGIGKSALISRLLLDARRRGAVYAVARCRPSIFPAPYAPWASLVEGLRAARALPERRWQALPRLVPSLAGAQRPLQLEANTIAPFDAPTTAPTTRELCELVTQCATARPVVLVIEDLEHADHASWEVCRQLAQQLDSERLLLCLTTDDAATISTRAGLAGCRRHSEIRLQDLAAHEIRQWIGDLFADNRTATACVDHLVAAGTRSPLWSAHILHTLVDDGHLTFVGGAWRIANPAALEQALVAPSAEAMFSQRIGALSPKTRAIIGELATIGDSFEIDVALAAGVGDEAELLDAIDEALAAVIVCDDGAEPGDEFAFTHRAITAAAARTVEPMRRRRVHERIARGLEQVKPVALFEIAEHYDRAGMSDRAFEYALLAASRAAFVHAYDDAAVAYDRALAHVTTTSQRARLAALVADLPVRARRAGVA